MRNPLASSILTPGVFFNPAQATRVNGSPANTYGIKLDGQDITNGVNTSASQQQVQPSVEALEEVAVQSSNYSAGFWSGRFGTVPVHDEVRYEQLPRFCVRLLRERGLERLPEPTYCAEYSHS